MEMWIELAREADGAVTRLRFALRATDGPRNGHMRSYFEVCEEEAPVERVVAAPAASAKAAEASSAVQTPVPQPAP